MDLIRCFPNSPFVVLRDFNFNILRWLDGLEDGKDRSRDKMGKIGVNITTGDLKSYSGQHMKRQKNK